MFNIPTIHFSYKCHHQGMEKGRIKLAIYTRKIARYRQRHGAYVVQLCDAKQDAIHLAPCNSKDTKTKLTIDGVTQRKEKNR